MSQAFIRFLSKLTLLVALSSAAVTGAGAHELQPTVADLDVTEGQVRLEMRVNLEALMADIDLDGLEDTNDAENVADYDALRAEPAEAIADRVPGLIARWNALPLVTVDGAPVTLAQATLDIPRDVDMELPRLSTLTLTGPAPEGAGTATVTWPDGAGALVLRQQGVEDPYTGYIDGGSASDEIALGGGGARGGWASFFAYIPVGFDHILPQGLDHILFVLGLFFLSLHLRPLLFQVTAFTAAHTATLALGALGWVNVPGSIVEPLIAASIVYVAIENIFLGHLSRWRPLVVFGFGLLHGLGFASVLEEFGLPQDQFIPALLGFNVGVELGQLTVISLAALLIWLAVRAAMRADLEGEETLVREPDIMFRAVSITGSLVIALIGLYWVIERVFL